MKKSLEELVGVVLLGLVFLIIFVFYLMNNLKSPEYSDFNWKKYHLEYIVQVLLNYPVYYNSKCYISFQNFLTNLAESPSKLPSCYLEPLSAEGAEVLNEQLLVNTLKNYFEKVKSSGETFYISLNFGGFKKEIEIKGNINNKVFSFSYCIKKPFSLKSQYILSRDITGIENYVKISYCKLVNIG